MLNIKEFFNAHASELEAARNTVLAEISLDTVSTNTVFTPTYADACIYEIASRLINMGMPREEKAVSAIRRTLKNRLVKDAAYVAAKNRLPLRIDSAEPNIAQPIMTAEEARKLYDENKSVIDSIIERTISQHLNAEHYEILRDIAEHCAVEAIMYHAEPPVTAVGDLLRTELDIEIKYLHSQSSSIIAL